MINGYKCFYKGLVTHFSDTLELNRVYYSSQDVKFFKGGFHLCTNLEDTFRYFDTFNNEVDVAEVHGYGKTSKYDDEYNGFYDMYAVEFIKITKVLTRDEIIAYAIKLPEYRLDRFLSLYKLSDDEIMLFKKLFYNKPNIIKTIMYCQENIKDVYENNYQLKIKR